MDSPSDLSGGPIHASSCKMKDKRRRGSERLMNIAGSQEITIDLDAVRVWRMISDVTGSAVLPARDGRGRGVALRAADRM